MPRKDDFLDFFGHGSDKAEKPEEYAYSEEEYFLKEVAPLLAQLKDACEKHNLPVIATVAYEYIPGQGYHAALLANLHNDPPGRVPGHFLALWQIANGGQDVV